MKILTKSIAAMLLAHAGMSMAAGPQPTPEAAAAIERATAIAVPDEDSAPAAAALAASGPFLQGISEAERQRLISVGREVTTTILEAYEQRIRTDKSLTETGMKQRKFADSIADEAIQAERDKTLEFLGLDPESGSGLYIFVSWSMPLEMLRSYVLDAMWSGASVVFRGTPPERTFSDFVMKDLQQLVYGKSAAANISIDPRMFDIYKVDTVPTTVFSTVRLESPCDGGQQVSFEYQKETLAYSECPPLDESKYWKLAGAVSTHFALEQFKEAKAPGVEKHQRALSRGLATGQTPAKEQVSFTGKWESVLSPEEAEAVRRATEDLGKDLTAPGKSIIQGVLVEPKVAPRPPVAD